jgi:hypothetical protein
MPSTSTGPSARSGQKPPTAAESATFPSATEVRVDPFVGAARRPSGRRALSAVGLGTLRYRRSRGSNPFNLLPELRNAPQGNVLEGADRCSKPSRIERRRENGYPAKGRARRWAAPRTDSPAHRVDLLDLQGHLHARAPRCVHPGEPPRPPCLPFRSTRRRHRTEPPTRPPQPIAGLLHSVMPWHYSSRPRHTLSLPCRVPA